MKKRKGFTLIEVIVALVLIGIFLTAGMGVMINSGASSTASQNITVAQSLAESKMEEAIAMPYASISPEALASFPGSLSSYSSQIFVDFVNQANLDTTSVADTGYKRVRVRITHPSLKAPLQIETIRTNH